MENGEAKADKMKKVLCMEGWVEYVAKKARRGEGERRGRGEKGIR